MTLSSFPSPIARLLAAHAETRRHLDALADAGADAWPGAAAWFEGPARTAYEILETRLFPALIESMAGSDAVCLKGLTGGLARDRADLERRWRQAVRSAAADPAAREALAAWIEDYRGWLACADEELLPMAARLLDDAALDALAPDCARLEISG
ncbi:hemerythrin domain-containing protein [Castellaniella ginsengisoli]|uniref:Hemerythrin domain-containing protein n=1 Tax=Castellaniella ginsengisoli TaxID=546114 RepID=A0ABN1L1P0_9BURK